MNVNNRRKGKPKKRCLNAIDSDTRTAGVGVRMMWDTESSGEFGLRLADFKRLGGEARDRNNY